MNYIEAVESDLAARTAIDTLLQIAEVLPWERIVLATQIFADGGPAYHQRNIAQLLKRERRYEDKDRLAGLFTDADYPDGFRDPRLRAALFLGLSELIDSKGMIDADKAANILRKFEVAETPDLRDNLAAYAHRSADGTSVKWSVTDFASVVFAATSIASLARKVPWARLLTTSSRLLLRR